MGKACLKKSIRKNVPSSVMKRKRPVDVSETVLSSVNEEEHSMDVSEIVLSSAYEEESPVDVSEIVLSSAYEEESPVDASETVPSSVRKRKRSMIVRTIVLVILSVISLLPFYLMFVNATRGSQEIQGGISFLFGGHLLDNIATFDAKQSGVGISVLGTMLNSLIIAVPSTALSVYFSALTAYGFHAYDFKLKKFAWGVIMAIMMVPTQVYAIGFYKFMINLRLIDTYWPLIIPCIATPTVVFFMREYLLGALPLEMVEAARIDGATEFQIFNRMVVPIMKPAMATQAIFQFVASWNNLFMPSLIINSTSKKTLTMFVQMLMGDSFRTDYGVVFLALSITILPMLVMYFILSRYIVEGVSLGSVKE